MSNSNPDMLTVPEAARIADRHEMTIRRWIYAGLLPAKKVGKLGRFKINKQDLMDALEYKPSDGTERQSE